MEKFGGMKFKTVNKYLFLSLAVVWSICKLNLWLAKSYYTKKLETKLLFAVRILSKYL